MQRCASIREFPAARGRSPHNKEKNCHGVGGTERRSGREEREREKERRRERERARVHTVLILLDAEEADSINSHGREKRNDVVLVRAVVRDETATVVTLSGASGTESIHRSMGHTASADYRPE